MIWKLAITGYLPGTGMWCSSTPNYQPFERLNIYLGHEDVDKAYKVAKGTTVQLWDNADPTMLRALNRAVLGMKALVPNLGDIMGRALGNKVVIVYDPPKLGFMAGNLNYVYDNGWAGIEVGQNRLQQFTASGRFLDFAGQSSGQEARMTAGFAHELTHLIPHTIYNAPPKAEQSIYTEYCNQVKGFIRRGGKWAWYPASVSYNGILSVDCGDCDPQVGCNDPYHADPWEGLANAVGVYIAAPTIYNNQLNVSFDTQRDPLDLSHVRDFIENDFVTFAQ